MLHKHGGTLIACSALVFALLGARLDAAEIAKAVGPTIADDVGVNSFVITAPPVFSGDIPNGNWVRFSNNASLFSDNFGLMARGGGNENTDVVDPSPSVNFLDDSLTIFTGDQFGIVAEGDSDNFFGVIDTLNADTGFSFQDTAPNANGTFEATWEFDVSGAQDGLRVGIDFAAFGDFEGRRSDTLGETLRFDYSFDDVNFAPAFVNGFFDTDFTIIDQGFGVTPIDTSLPGQAIGDLPAEVIYSLDGGSQFAFNDPLTINDQVVLNDFETVSAEIGAATSDTLTLRLTAAIDTSSKVAAFRNIVIEDGFRVIPEPTSEVLLAWAAASSACRRRATVHPR